MEKFTIYCTEEQTKKAYELGAPIGVHPFDASIIKPNEKLSLFQHLVCIDEKYYFLPTAEQMIGWLEEQYVRVYVQPYTDECDKRFKGKIHTVGELIVKDSKSRKEATLAAIDAALNYLTKKEK